MLLNTLVYALLHLTIPLQPVSSAPFLENSLILGKGFYFVGTKTHLYKWDLEGELIWEAKARSGERFIYFYWQEDTLLVTALIDEKPVIIEFKGSTRKVFEVDKFYEFKKIDKTLFLTTSLTMRAFMLDDYYFQFQKVSINLNAPDLDLKTLDKPFFKLSLAQERLLFNFKEAWIVKNREGIWCGLNEIEPKIFIFDQASIDAEFYRGTTSPIKTPSLNINLPHFVKHPENWFQMPKGVHSRAKYDQQFKHWWYSFSRFKGFYAFGDGYLIGYSVPICDKGVCDDEALYLVRLDQDFAVTGEPLKTHGLLMGLLDDVIYVMEPRYEVPDNPAQGGMAPLVKKLYFPEP